MTAGTPLRNSRPKENTIKCLTKFIMFLPAVEKVAFQIWEV